MMIITLRARLFFTSVYIKSTYQFEAIKLNSYRFELAVFK